MQFDSKKRNEQFSAEMHDWLRAYGKADGPQAMNLEGDLMRLVCNQVRERFEISARQPIEAVGIYRSGEWLVMVNAQEMTAEFRNRFDCLSVGACSGRELMKKDEFVDAMLDLLEKMLDLLEQMHPSYRGKMEARAREAELLR